MAESLQLLQRAEVAQEAEHLGAVAQREERVGQLGRRRREIRRNRDRLM